MNYNSRIGAQLLINLTSNLFTGMTDAAWSVMLRYNITNEKHQISFGSKSFPSRSVKVGENDPSSSTSMSMVAPRTFMKAV